MCVGQHEGGGADKILKVEDREGVKLGKYLQSYIVAL
jgi:hypothetical protein